MKKYRYLQSFLLLFLIPSFACASCTDEEIKDFEAIEKDYKIEYKINKLSNTYSLILANPEPNKYTYTVKGINTILACKINQEGDTECNGVPPDAYSINIVGNTQTCDSVLKRTFLSLKPYNKYSEDSLCDDIREFVLCQETYDREIDYETFVSRVKVYKENKNKEANNKNNKKIDIEKIKEYLENNLFQVIVIAVFIILVTITIIITVITAKKSRRLE